MKPATFPEARILFTPPRGLGPAWRRISGHRWWMKGGPWDGQEFLVVAWRPSGDDLQRLNDGAPVYLTMFGPISPHRMTTTFAEAMEQ